MKVGSSSRRISGILVGLFTTDHTRVACGDAKIPISSNSSTSSVVLTTTEINNTKKKKNYYY
jgi:hypothetical protein